MFKRIPSKFYSNFLNKEIINEADYVKSKNLDHVLLWTNNATTGIMDIDGIVLSKDDILTSHGKLLENIKTYLTYKEHYNDKNIPFVIYGNPNLKRILDNKRNHSKNFRIWKKDKVCAFWAFSEEFSIKLSKDVNQVFNYIKSISDINDWQFQTYDLLEDYETLKYGEFIDYIQGSNSNSMDSYNKRLEDLELHLMDPAIKGQEMKKLGIKPKMPNLSLKDRQKLYGESLVKESPDKIQISFQNKKWYDIFAKRFQSRQPYFSLKFDMNGNIPFVITNGILIYSPSPITHYDIWDAIVAYDEEKYEFEDYEIKFISDSGDVDINNIMSKISFDDLDRPGDFSKNSKTIFGRVFTKIGVVSFWNTLNQIDDTSKKLIIELLKNYNNYPLNEWLFQPLEYTKDSNFSFKSGISGGMVEDNPGYVDFLTYDEFMLNEGEDVDFNLKLPMHEINPNIKGDILKKFGVKPKTPIPLDLKQKKLASESTLLEESVSKKYYAFDWDDNLMFMPTKIYTLDDKGNVVPLSTEEFAEHRVKIGKEPFEFEGHTIVGYTTEFNPFKDFRVQGDEQFIKDCMTAKTGPAWSDFVEAVNSGSIFSIITARGHNPNTLKQAVKNLIEQNMHGLNYNKCTKNLIKYLRLSKDKHRFQSREQLFNWYLDKLCKWYPVTFGEGSAGNPEQLKIKAMIHFKNHVNRKFNNLNLKFKNDVSNKFKLGFSDDDIRNVKSMSKVKGVTLFSTYGNKKTKYKPEIENVNEAVVPFDKNITRKIRKGISKTWKSGRNSNFKPNTFGFDIEYDVFGDGLEFLIENKDKLTNDMISYFKILFKSDFYKQISDLKISQRIIHPRYEDITLVLSLTKFIINRENLKGESETNLIDLLKSKNAIHIINPYLKDYISEMIDSNYNKDGNYPLIDSYLDISDFEYDEAEHFEAIKQILKENGYELSQYADTDYSKWRAGIDDEKFEIASPILTNRDIPKIKKLLNEFNNYFKSKNIKSFNGKCSAHVHIGNNLTPFEILCINSMVDEESLYELSKDRDLGYTRPKSEFISYFLYQVFKTYGPKLLLGKEIKLKEDELERLVLLSRNKYYGINYWTQAETTEFRFLSNEVLLDVNKFLESINYYQLLVRLSKTRKTITLPLKTDEWIVNNLTNDKSLFIKKVNNDFSIKLKNLE